MVEPDPAFVEQLEENQRIATELLRHASELMVLANKLINHSNLQWSGYARQLVEAEEPEVEAPRPKRRKMRTRPVSP